jgi:hypothetical protein
MQGRIVLLAVVLMLVLAVPLMASNTPRHWYYPTDTTGIVCAPDSLDKGPGPYIGPEDGDSDLLERPLQWFTRVSKYAIDNAKWLWRRML